MNQDPFKEYIRQTENNRICVSCMPSFVYDLIELLYHILEGGTMEAHES